MARKLVLPQLVLLGHVAFDLLVKLGVSVVSPFSLSSSAPRISSPQVESGSESRIS
jgi:hypothetical protein